MGRQKKTAEGQGRAAVAPRASRSAIFHPGGPVLAFEVAGQRYALPVDHVIQIIEMVAITPLPKVPEIVVGVVDFHGLVIPVVDTRRRFEGAYQPYTLHTPIVVGRLDGRVVGLVVDAVIGVLELKPEQAKRPAEIFTVEMAPRIQYITGVARLEDGLLMILDPATILSRQEESSLAKALSGQSS